MRKFYTKYFQYYLNNPDKPNLSKWFYLSVVIVILMNIYLSTSPTSLFLPMFVGGAVSFILLLISFYFGYLGMMTNIIVSLYGISRTLWLWSTRREDYLFLIITFQIAVLGASFFISYLSEKGKNKQNQLEWLSMVDGLTEVFNHRYFHQKLEQEIERALKGASSLALVMMDIDNFKKYNDSMGHRAGDVILKDTAEFLKNSVSGSDIVFRYGGDEFAILLTAYDKEKDMKRFECIIKAYEELNIIAGNSQNCSHLTLSMGLSTFPENARDKENLIKQADGALYLAKNTGRNKIQFCRDTLEEIRELLNINDVQIMGNLRVLLATVTIKDKYTLGHSERVSDYVFSISNALGLNADEIKRNQLAALLHDIGKIEIPERILNKNGKLSKEEMEQIKKHPVYSAEILEPLKEIHGIISCVRHHHEQYDGSGYPDGLTEEHIPLGARILTVADSFDAMLSDRPYRKGVSSQYAVQQLIECSGTQFDPKIVDVFIQTMNLMTK